jgi:hypothetical protein
MSSRVLKRPHIEGDALSQINESDELDEYGMTIKTRVGQT